MKVSGSWSRVNKVLPIIYLIIIISSLSYYIVRVLQPPETAFDDAYMFMRYARNILDGFGIAWNPGAEWTYGSTSLPHLFIVTMLNAALPFSMPWILRLSSILPACSAVIILIVAGSSLSRHSFLHNNFLAWTAIIIPCVMTIEPFIFHSRTGMDTMLSMAGIALLVFITAKLQSRSEIESRLFQVMLVCAYLAWAVRPDNIIYVTVMPLLTLVFHNDLKQKRLYIVRYIGFIGIMIIFDLLVKYALFNDPLPLSFYVKNLFSSSGYDGLYKWNPWQYLLLFIRANIVIFIIFIITFKVKYYKILTPYFASILLTFGYYFTVVQIMGQQARFYFPSLSVLVIITVLSADRFFSEEIDLKKWTFLGTRAASILLLFLLMSGMGHLATSYKMDHQKTEMLSEGKVASETTLGWWQSIQIMARLAENFPPGTKLALTEYGYIGAVAPHLQIIDPLGLNDRTFAHHGFSAQEFFKRKPDIIWLPHPDYTAIRSAILTSNEFKESYHYYPHILDYGLAIRK